MIKSFKEMMKVDVSKYVKEREDEKAKVKAKYLPWAACLLLLYENGAEDVLFYPVPGPDGSTLRKSEKSFVDRYGVTNQVYEVLVHIKVDDKEWDVVYPVLNGHLPVKDDTMNQLRLSNAIRRAFVKGIAERTGLGFSLWLEDDELPQVEETEDLTKHSLAKCKQRMQELITAKINSGLSLNVIADRLGRTEDEVRGMMGWYGALAKMEKAIWEMQP